jgi:glycosyltransferase involved in cell wall biosynthesis
MNYPKISIVTPNYNGGEYLENTIISILSQNYPNLEYIIIDGGSSDDSVNIIRKYEKKLSYWVSESDNGMYDAIQKGFAKSTGEIMAWLNSDDMYHPKAFFIIAEIFSNFLNVNWLTGMSTKFDELGRTIDCSQSKSFSKFDFYNHDFKWIMQETTFWRRSLWESSGSYLNTNLKYAGDFELWLRFIKNENLYVIDALIGGFRLRSSNQLSLDHMDEYLNEVKFAIESIELNKKEINILLNYKRLIKFNSVLSKLKIFKTAWMIKIFRKKFFQVPSKIIFDRNKMRFIFSQS